MGGDPSRRDQNLYCTYHRDKRHTIKQCRVLKDHLEQLMYLKMFVVDPRSQKAGQGAWPRENSLSSFLGVIKVIHTAPRGSQVSKRRGCWLWYQQKAAQMINPPRRN